MSLPGYITMKDVAARLGVSPSRVRQLVLEFRTEGVELGTVVSGVRHLTASEAQKLEERHMEKRAYSKAQ